MNFTPHHPIQTKKRPSEVRLSMEKRIVVLDADAAQCREISNLLRSFDVKVAHSLSELQEYLIESECRAILIDLDTVSIDNRTLGHIKRQHPDTEIIAKSERRFHPELEEALRSHIHSCLAKPLDADELIFWLKSIFDNSAPAGKARNPIES